MIVHSSEYEITRASSVNVLDRFWHSRSTPRMILCHGGPRSVMIDMSMHCHGSVTDLSTLDGCGDTALT